MALCSPDGGRLSRASSDPGGLAQAPAPRPDQAGTGASLERGGQDLSFHPWDTRLAGPPEWSGRSLSPKRGKAPGFLPPGAGQAGLLSRPARTRRGPFLLEFFSGLNSSEGRGEKWYGDGSPRQSSEGISAFHCQRSDFPHFLSQTYCAPGCGSWKAVWGWFSYGRVTRGCRLTSSNLQLSTGTTRKGAAPTSQAFLRDSSTKAHHNC